MSQIESATGSTGTINASFSVGNKNGNTLSLRSKANWM